MRGIIQKPMLGDECMSDGTSIADRGNVLKTLFNEGSGNTVADLSGNGNTGTIPSTFLWSGEGIDCQNQNDTIDTVGTDFQLTNQLTAIICFKAATLTSESNPLFAKNGYHGVDADFGIKISASSGTTAFSCVQRYKIVTGLTVTGEKTTLALTVDIAAQTSAIYKNGIYVDALLNGTWPTPPLPNSNIVKMGDNLTGIIYYAYLYNRALSPSEIAFQKREPFGDLGPRRFLPYAPVAVGGVVVPWHLFFNKVA